MKNISLENESIVPSKIVCIGRNYVEHIAELGNEIPDEMVIFLKPNSAISTTLTACHQEPLHYEAEICFVYQQGRFSAVGVGLDLTKRALQSQLKAKKLPWERAKAFDGSAVFSEFIAIENIASTMCVQLKINNQIIQQGGVELMMYKPDEILAEIQTFMTLQDGDVVMTGTPKGVGVIHKGDMFEASILIEDNILVSKKWLAH
ncbi:fumarylacetoacetate hydrolase family protein [Colwellia sp. 1_MG-2023]|uniref:fumarylacetoacetate hydrolase family protein n=1 Tax=Colwellia sp. 1_MG-2023 TaxID=3062649 RepID=UPI0026E1788A|nr:fumarylacetoacetate hydrolase family protein [Colwellia sp. 1_MG-2023]MDO6447074.1 fumarylacetoacetate hydrolase family protein [Colwellia sp. 1_MG-2023]